MYSVAIVSGVWCFKKFSLVVFMRFRKKGTLFKRLVDLALEH